MVNEGVEGPAIYDLMEDYLGKQGTVTVERNDAVKVVGI